MKLQRRRGVLGGDRFCGHLPGEFSGCDRFLDCGSDIGETATSIAEVEPLSKPSRPRNRPPKPPSTGKGTGPAALFYRAFSFSL